MRLIDADALKAIRFHDLPYSQIVPADCDTDEKVYAYKLGWNDAIDAIVESAPTVDAVEVVRCKDCKWYEESIYPELRPTRFCYRLKNNKGVHIGYNWDSNDFCSYGERREER